MRMSIIIPVYNAAATLRRCLDSILAQSYGDYQVVVVDDASTDESLAIAESYAARDERFLVLASAHCGTGAARNKGLAVAAGQYVVYMDADDYWIREDLLQALDDRIRDLPADVYMYQMAKVTEDGAVLKRFDKQLFSCADQVMALDAVYQDLVADGHTLAAAWNKCVKRQLLLENEIRFREDVLGEDIDWVLQLFSYVQTICLVNIRAYAYTQHKSPSRSTRSDAPNDLVTIVSDWAEKLNRETMAHRDAVAGVVAFEYGICMGSHHLLSKENKKRMRCSVRLLQGGLDRKTMLIHRFCTVFGYDLTCAAVRLYLLLRRIW